MKLTIIPSDKLVIMDGVALSFEFTVDANYHAIHWDGKRGTIETITGDNIPLKNMTEFEDIIAQHRENVAIEKNKIRLAELEFNKPENIWKRKMQELDNSLPRIAEDLMDIIIGKGLITKAELPAKVRLDYDNKKKIRGEKPK